MHTQHGIEYQQQLRYCLKAALDTIESVSGADGRRQLYEAFWNSQYIVFSAVSIVYIYLIQTARQRIPQGSLDKGAGTTQSDSQSLLEMARTGQQSLAHVTDRNAPAWKYTLILEGLHGEAFRLMRPDRMFASSTIKHMSELLPGSVGPGPSSGILQSPTSGAGNHTLQKGSGTQIGDSSQDSVNASSDVTAGDFDRPSETDLSEAPLFDASSEELFRELMSASASNDVGSDFWTQLDSFPICQW